MDNKIKEARDYFANSDAVSTPIMHGRVLAEAVFAADPTSKADDVRNAALEEVAKIIHYPACWDTAAYPSLEDALHEIVSGNFACSECALKTAPSLPPQGEATECDACQGNGYLPIRDGTYFATCSSCHGAGLFSSFLPHGEMPDPKSIEWYKQSLHRHTEKLASVWEAFEAYKSSHPDLAQGEAQAFQQRVAPWMQDAFGPEIAADTMERNHRFFEESTELVQANGMTRSEAHQLVDYTFDRPVGEPAQEAGGVMVTLAALCLASGLDMHAAGETELARINNPATMAKIRAKQAAKPKHSPLPAAIAPQGQRGKAIAWNIMDRFGGKPLFTVYTASEAANYHPENVVPLYEHAAQALPVADTASADAVPEAISRALLGKIVDEAFDGACEDTSPIEDIYRIIAAQYGAPTVAHSECANARMQTLESAVKAMNKFLDRDYRVVTNVIELQCETHDQAWNYLHEIRGIVTAALQQTQGSGNE